MENERTINTFQADWEREIENKSFEELAKVIANKDVYSPPFVEMVKQKIKTLAEYDEERLNEIIEEENIERQRKEELANQRMSLWLKFFLVVLALGGARCLYNAISALSPEKYGYNLPLMGYDIAVSIGIVILAGYTFYSLYTRKKNAIYLVRSYIAINLLLYGALFLSHAISEVRILAGVISAIVWLCYFAYSERVEELYPEEERVFFKHDKYILGSIILIPIILFVWALNYTPSVPPTTIAETIDISEIDQSSYIIDEDKLEPDEITDGYIIIKLPKGVDYKLIEREDGEKCFDLSNNKNDPDYVVRVIGQGNVEASDVAFSYLWEQFQDSAMMGLPHEIVKNEMIDIKSSKCYRTIMKYKLNVDFIWDFTLLYNPNMKKLCLLNSYYNDDTKVPVDQIIDGIRFKQE